MSMITEGVRAKIIIAMKFMYIIVFNCLLASCNTFMCNFVKAMDLEACIALKFIPPT